MKIIFIILSMIFLNSCGVMEIDVFDLRDKFYKKPNHVTNFEFYKYLDILNINRSTPIIFNKRKNGVVGTCTKYSNYRVIEIDPISWENLPDSNRLALLAHEIGHCDYNLEHNTNILENGCFESVMYPSNFGDNCWSDYKNYYMEIFNKG